MRRKIRPIDPNELFEADDIDKTTIKGEMRKLYPAIHQKLSLSVGRWSARDMVKWLEERGVCMSVELFRVYLNELDHEQGYSRSKNKFLGSDDTCTNTAPPCTYPAITQSSGENNTKHRKPLDEIKPGRPGREAKKVDVKKALAEKQDTSKYNAD